MLKIKLEDIPKPRGIEKPHIDLINEAKNKQMERIIMPLPNNYGVENFGKLVRFGGTIFNGVKNAMSDDGKISLSEGLGIAVSLVPQTIGLISAIPEIPKEIVFDQISEEDHAQIASFIDEFDLAGDTKEASKDLVNWILQGKDIYFKHFGGRQAPQP